MSTPITNVPPITWDNGMPVVPPQSQVRTGRAADFTAAYGSALNTDPRTSQGQLIDSDTAIIGDSNAQIAYIASMVDPDQSEGAWQDAIGAIYYIERIAAAGSVKTVTCIGAVNTPIPAGALLQDPSGYPWAATGAIDLGGTGQAIGTFQCTTVGPIAWPGNTPCTILTQVNGWDQAVSTAAAALGRLTENRAAFENRRRNSVAINGTGQTPAVRGAVLAVPNVLSAFAFDNGTDNTVNIGVTNYPVVKHSLLVSVYGGAAAAIAQAIWSKKSGGCNYNGNTTYTVVDTSYPVGSQPQYPVTWLTAAPTPVYFLVTLQNNAALPSDIVAQVQAAVLATFFGVDAAGSVPAGIALAISGSRYAAQINLISDAVNIESILVALQTVVSGEFIGSGNGATVTFTHVAAHLAVVPGTVFVVAGSVVATDDGYGNLTGTGIAAGTINYATGAMSITYSAAPANTVPIQTNYNYANPTSSILTMGVDQMPTLFTSYVAVALV